MLIPKFINKANPTGAEPVPQAALFNDTQNLTVSVQPGKTYLFHVVNIGAFAGQYIWFEGHNMTIVEVDGVFTDQAEAELIYVAAAQRCSFLITTKNETTANYPFISSMDTVSFVLPHCHFTAYNSQDTLRQNSKWTQLERDWMASLR